MTLSIYSNQELKDTLQKLKSTALSGERVSSWSSAGTNVSKEFFGEDPQKIVSRIAREIAGRKAAGTFPLEELPEIAPQARKRVFPGLIAV